MQVVVARARHRTDERGKKKERNDRTKTERLVHVPMYANMMKHNHDINIYTYGFLLPTLIQQSKPHLVVGRGVLRTVSR
jgi:hypothetical protein